MDRFREDICCLIIPSSTDKNLEFHLTYLGNNATQNVMIISSRLDTLLGQWLKIKEYVIAPVDHRLIAILFVQPISKNDFFEVRLRQATGRRDIYIPNPLKNTDKLWTSGVLRANRKWISRGVVDRLIIYPQFPFAFIEIRNEQNVYFVESDFELHCKERNVKFVPTSKRDIFLLIFSDILDDHKDCAKLLRQYLKNPYHFVWRSVAIQPFIVGFPRPPIMDIVVTSFAIEDPLNYMIDGDIAKEEVDQLKGLSEFDVLSDFVLLSFLNGSRFPTRFKN